MNVPPLSYVPLVILGHTDDGADGHERLAFRSVPGVFATHVNDQAEPARPLIQHSSARSRRPGRGHMFAKTTRNRPAHAADTLQSP